MILLRSLIFNIIFYIHTIAVLVGVTPVYFFLPRQGSMAVVRYWARANLWLLKVVCGLQYELRGLHNIPKGGFIFAGKHQSIWETFALLPVFHDPAYIIKRQLLYVPIWGWWAAKCRMIFVDRTGGAKAMRQIVAGAKRELAAGRPIMIFPEGTRRPPGAPPDYKFGIVFLYRQLKAPVLPAGLNSGLFWPRRKFLRFPGTIVVEFLPPIPAGLPPGQFERRLEEEIEASSDRLLVEAAEGPSPPPLSQSAVERLAALRTNSSGAIAGAGLRP